MEEGHTRHYAQAPRELRHAKRHVCQNCPDDVFRVHNRNKHHPCKQGWNLMSKCPSWVNLHVKYSSDFTETVKIQLRIQKTFQTLFVTGNFERCPSFEIPTLRALTLSPITNILITLYSCFIHMHCMIGLHFQHFNGSYITLF